MHIINLKNVALALLFHSLLPSNESYVYGFQNGLSYHARSHHFLESGFGPPISKSHITKRKYKSHLSATPENQSTEVDDYLFDVKTTTFLVGGQSLLIGVAALFAAIFKVPNFGLGPSVEFSMSSIQQGFLMALPLGLLVLFLDSLEDKIPALKDVTKATQRSVLALLGGKFKPVIGLVTAIGLGFAAGFGEEMLFRGVLQYKLCSFLPDVLSVAFSSIIFAALHAVTPLYAFLAWIASLYFGYLYQITTNLAVPIFTHAIYDVAALFYAHWTVSRLSDEEKSKLLI